MKLPRPYIPIDIRLQVAERQFGYSLVTIGQSKKERLKLVLKLLFDGEPYHLDHDPALEHRQKLYHNCVHVAYSPPANDPDHLIYRKADNHRIKTFVRGDGAQLSDAAKARKDKRIARNRDPKRRKYKWPKQKIRNRPWQSRNGIAGRD